MGRYRPSQRRGSCYITPEGYANLQQESQDLWQTRAEVTRALSAAAAEGDRSENAEYIYRKKQLREIDRRIRYLQTRLDELQVVSLKPSNEEQVFFGAWVELETADGKILTYRIVGPDEYDLDKGYISMDSPVAKALLKKHLDDEVDVVTPEGKVTYSIIDIRYEDKD